MFTIFIPPLMTVLACILLWRTRGADRVLSGAIAALGALFCVWYFGFLAM